MGVPQSSRAREPEAFRLAENQVRKGLQVLLIDPRKRSALPALPNLGRLRPCR